jgi:hypothetical protein
LVFVALWHIRNNGSTFALSQVTPDPFKPPKVIRVSKPLAAYSQLHTALALWFSYGDPVSIHTLAVAAQELLQGLAGKDHKPPQMRKWIKQFSPKVQKAMRDPQNFFKHAWTDSKVVRTYQPFIGETILGDACLLHQDLYGLTGFIRAFTIRLCFEDPPMCAPADLTHKITHGIRMDDLAGLNRPEFLDTVLARLRAVRVS